MNSKGNWKKKVLKILDLVDKDPAEVLMDRWLVIRMIVPMTSPDAFVARSNLVPSAILWGPDFDGWNSSFLHIYSKPWFAQVTELSQQGNGVVIMDRPHGMLSPLRNLMYERRGKRHVGFRRLTRMNSSNTDPNSPPKPSWSINLILSTRRSSITQPYPVGYVAIKDTKISNRPVRNKKLTAEIQEQQVIDFGNNFGRAKQDLSRHRFTMGTLDSDEKIIKTLKWWLTHDQERNSKAQADQDWILNSFSMDRYAEDVWKMVWQVKEGHSGMILPYKFDFFVTIDSSKDQIDKLQLVVINVDDNCSILWMVPCLTLGSVLARFLKAPAGVFEAVGPEHHSRTNFWNSKARS
ncbi:hypothetical protein PSTG_13406 [Puccinia striiformis f. sp. tritici PST-78]|uniref:Uncharacterized protein n=1 Tax=Puccinia striiformis f. sp. tritici PST-78 TaxID=1165861 RepID=A0A0L0V1P7_9BASI|nr:hypothetical protein PSTG_13406 [Puccinia striiformis f. sp. tritici PST-78]